MTGLAFTSDTQLIDLLHHANELQQRKNLPYDQEAYKATIDMQGMIALYAKENIHKLRSERGEDPVLGPSANPTNPQFWKDLADSKGWAIKEPLSKFFSSSNWSNNSNWRESEMEVSGNIHIDTKGFFSGIKTEWMNMPGVQGGIEELVAKFLAMCNEVDLKDLNMTKLPQAQQCISIGTISDGSSSVQATANIQPKVSVLYVGLEMKSTQALTSGHGEKISARIQVSQSTVEARLNLNAIRSSKGYLDATRKRMIDLGLDEFQKVLAKS